MVGDRPVTGARILILDDEEAESRLVQRILTSGGYSNVQAINDPRRFMATFHQFAPDLILLDLTMPHMDGFRDPKIAPARA